MEAKRKSDGKIIEVTPLIQAVFRDKETKEIYYAHQLDFNVEKQKQSETTIDREEYEQLCKYRRCCSNWVQIVVCLHCGEFNPNGYICANCGKDRNH